MGPLRREGFALLVVLGVVVVVGLGALLVKLSGGLALPPLLQPDRHLTPTARALPEGSRARQEALTSVRQGALAQLALGGLAGVLLLGLGGLRSEVAGLRERLEELAED